MKKTYFMHASAIMMAFAFGMVSCEQSQDNPVPAEPTEPEVQYEEFTYDFAAAFEASENPGNKNGSAANGQVFYGWEKADKTDSKRQDYKGYEWVEGSVLPQICNVWRRSDRINGNIKEGGLYCPSDKEMAIDGLSEGSIVQIFYNPPMVNDTQTTDLKEVPFGTWSAWVGGELTTPSNPDWTVGESTGLPYGDGSVIRYSDLSGYSKLIVVATDGTPRFLFNRDVNDGQWNADEAESHLIEYPKGDDVWSAKYFTVEEIEGGKRYIVDLAQMVKDKGYAHLHAIKGANWTNCTVTSMTLESTIQVPSDAKMLWAIGDGTSEGGPGVVRATAEIDGAEAVTGVTEIASGATITVKSVTPAENGTGYIVFKVKKGMVITKVVIKNPIIEAE
jgi:hypothetical protein